MPRDPLSVALRPRTPWEAADLGVELARAWITPIARVWGLAYAAPAITLVLVSPWPFAALLVAWWLRPCAERALLDVLARRTFGRPAPLRAVLATMWQLPRTPGALVWSLTSRRLTPVRTIWLAVWHLEGLRGAEARTRVAVLTRDGQGVAAWCGLIGLLTTVLLALAFFVTMVALLPDATGTALAEWLSGHAPLPLAHARLWSALFIVADALCAPWITAAVFGLYISRRTTLEAWDIEQVFRGLSRRLASMVVVGAVLAGAAAPTSAEPPLPERSPDAAAAAPMHDDSRPRGQGDGAIGGAARETFDAQEAIRRILAGREFGREETVQQWRFRQGARRADSPPPAWVAWLLATVPGLAAALRWAMWVVAGALIGWLALVTARRRTGRRLEQPEPESTVEIDEAGHVAAPVRAALTQARAALARGALVDALGLLYTGALQACVARGALELQPGDTEADCLRRVRGRLPVETEHALRDVVRTWQAVAYARRTPSDDHVRAMCDAYARHFDGADR